MERTIRRGDIYYADLNPVIGSEQGGTRPVLIISNDTGNKYSPTVIIAAITSRVRTKAKLPTHTAIKDFEGLNKDSVILLSRGSPVFATQRKTGCEDFVLSPCSPWGTAIFPSTQKTFLFFL